MTSAPQSANHCRHARPGRVAQVLHDQRLASAGALADNDNLLLGLGNPAVCAARGLRADRPVRADDRRTGRLYPLHDALNECHPVTERQREPHQGFVRIARGRAVPPSPLVEPDAHGQAVLLRTESLLHALVASAVLSNRQVVEVIEIAAEVKDEVATAHHESRKRIDESLRLLAEMRASFESDEGRA